MSMQRRHFELIAETIKRARFSPNVSPFKGSSEDAHSTIAREFAQSLKATKWTNEPPRLSLGPRARSAVQHVPLPHRLRGRGDFTPTTPARQSAA